nr:MAG: hypothetical protein [Bacteriophage sp.]
MRSLEPSLPSIPPNEVDVVIATLSGFTTSGTITSPSVLVFSSLTCGLSLVSLFSTTSAGFSSGFGASTVVATVS